MEFPNSDCRSIVTKGNRHAYQNGRQNRLQLRRRQDKNHRTAYERGRLSRGLYRRRRRPAPIMGIEGESLIGVYSANEYLTRANLMKALPIRKGRRLRD